MTISETLNFASSLTKEKLKRIFDIVEKKRQERETQETKNQEVEK